MSVGHILLDGVEYAVRNQNDIIRVNSNQMAAKVGSGAGDYDDLQNWAGWLMDSWEAGVGKKDAEGGGFLASTAETRFKGQLALPSICRLMPTGYEVMVPTVNGWSDNLDQLLGTIISTLTYKSIPVGEDETIKKLANGFRMDTDPIAIDTFDIFLPGKTASCTDVVVELWYDEGNITDETTGPTTLKSSVTVPLREEPGWYWYHITTMETFGGAFTDPTWYFLVVYPAAGTLLVPTISYPMDYSWRYFTGAETLPSEGWTQTDPDEPTQNTSSFLSYWHDRDEVSASLGGIVHGGDYDYIAMNTGASSYVQLFETGVGVAGRTGTLGATVTDLMALDGRIYIGLGDTVLYAYLPDDGTDTESSAAVAANKFTLFNGYIWLSDGADLYYTADEIEWILVKVGMTNREQITNMGGLLDGTLFVTTNRSCYIVNDGDIVQWISNFGNPRASNGKYMVNFQGQIYFSMGETLMRFDGENMLPIGPDLEEGLPLHHAGEINGIAANNNWLVVGVGGETGSIWAWNGQGWHFIAELPTGDSIKAIGYSHEDDNGFAWFVVAGTEGTLYEVAAADTRKSQRKAAAFANPDFHYHHFSGWLETDWFYGGLREVLKDWESVFVDGENISENNFVEVYWQENDGDDWQFLGTVTEPTQEIRWSDYTTRPSGRRVRIGIALYNSFQPGTPVITAVRVKYQPMVTDRWRWQITIVASEGQDMIDGEPNAATRDSIVSHLDTLSKRVKPFILQDEAGVQYEVKMMTMTRQPEKIEYMPGTVSLDVNWVYSLSLEQVVAEEFNSV
jgi:hypothetical protein